MDIKDTLLEELRTLREQNNMLHSVSHLENPNLYQAALFNTIDRIERILYAIVESMKASGGSNG